MKNQIPWHGLGGNDDISTLQVFGQWFNVVTDEVFNEGAAREQFIKRLQQTELKNDK